MYGGGIQNRWSTATTNQATQYADQYDAKATRAKSMRGVKASCNDCVGSGFRVCQGTGCLGCCTRWLICIFTLALAMTAGTGAWMAYYNLHLRFWLAHLVYLALISLTVSLALTFFSFAYTAYVQSYRLSARDRSTAGFIANSMQDAPCILSVRALRTLFFLVFLMASCTVIVGGCVLQFGGRMERQLLHNCGKSGTTHYLEVAYEGLSKFHDKCKEDPKHKDMPVHECPGYQPTEPAYAAYLRYLEATSGCMGFCERAEKPLYAVPGDGVAKKMSCSNYMANFIWTASLAVGVTNTVIGVLLLCLSMSLLCYGDL